MKRMKAASIVNSSKTGKGKSVHGYAMNVCAVNEYGYNHF